MWIDVKDELPAVLVPVLILISKGNYSKRYRPISGYFTETGRWWGCNEEGDASPVPEFSGKVFNDEKIEVIYWQYIELLPEHLSLQMQKDANNSEEKL